MKDAIVDSDVVDAFCTHCKREVIVDHSRRCPDCEQLVDPRSLPRVTPSPVRAGQVKLLTADGEGFADSPAPSPAPKVPPDPILLPKWIEEARWWHTATARFRAALAKEEEQLVGDLRRVRATLRLLDQIQERVTLPDAK